MYAFSFKYDFEAARSDYEVAQAIPNVFHDNNNFELPDVLYVHGTWLGWDDSGLASIDLKITDYAGKEINEGLFEGAEDDCGSTLIELFRARIARMSGNPFD